MVFLADISKSDGTPDLIPFTRDGIPGHADALECVLIPEDNRGGFSIVVDNEGPTVTVLFRSALNSANTDFELAAPLQQAVIDAIPNKSSKLEGVEMTDEPSAERLRDRWREAQQKSLGEEMLAFSELLAHPGACWQDLLDGIARPGIVGEDAWLQLRIRIKDVGLAGAIRRDSDFWRSILTSRGIDPVSKCRSATEGAGAGERDTGDHDQ